MDPKQANSYVITTWDELCPCGKVHRLYFIGDSDTADAIGKRVFALFTQEWPLQTTPTQHVINRDLLDSFLRSQMLP